MRGARRLSSVPYGLRAPAPGLETAVCIFAKAFVPGEVKTRLIPALGAEGAAELARAMFEDVRAVVGGLGWVHSVIASTGDWVIQPRDSEANWSQGKGHLGARLERVLRRALERADKAIAIGSDSPGLEPHHFSRARAMLDTHDAVLGPAADGGFYLVGLRRCPEGLFDGIAWSQPRTLADTRARFDAMGVTTGLVTPWFDVDAPEDVRRIRHLIESGRLWSPRTAATLRRLGIAGESAQELGPS